MKGAEQTYPLRIALLGSTGSIGLQTLDVVRRHADKVRVVALAVNSSTAQLQKQMAEFGVSHVAVGNEEAFSDVVRDALLAQARENAALWAGRRAQVASGNPQQARENAAATAAQAVYEKADIQHARESAAFSVGAGAQAVAALCQLPEVDMVVNALVGAAGLQASFDTLRANKRLALANKESLVVGGDVIMPLASHDTLLPIDSEHGAIYQCLLGEDAKEVSKLWVTASGGPFRGKKPSDLKDITPKQALAHPTWNMGPKISIDSSTLMNKGLEVIEAHHLFAMPYDQIEVVVQPQSAIHSMVEFSDGSVKAHLGTTDMRIPIQFALSYPNRWEAPVKPIDFRELGQLSFESPDEDTFRCLALARAAGKAGGTLPCVMNAANEVAVAAFLEERCSYLGIAQVVEKTMERFSAQPVESIEQLLDVDAQARLCASSLVGV